MVKKEKEKVVYERTRELKTYYYTGSQIVQLITYVVRIKNNWVKRLFGSGKYDFTIYQNNPINTEAFYDIEYSSNGYINAVKSYEKSLAMKWITEHKNNPDID